MQWFVLTLFPEMINPVVNASILKRAQKQGLIQIEVVDIRDFADDLHKTVDDYPYGGGPGMIMKPDPVYKAMEWVEGRSVTKPFTVMMTPQGETFDVKMARELGTKACVAVLTGHYEGFDERIRNLADLEISIGDYVLTGGEVPALVVIDAVCRLIPGVLGDFESAQKDSFSEGLLEGPQYTRPAEYRGMKVPDVLLRGDHAAVERWRRKESIRRTYLRRPDLIEKACLTYEDRRYLREIMDEEK